MDFKVKCIRYIDDATQQFTPGKVYNVTDGKLVSDTGFEYDAWALPSNGKADFNALRKWFAKFYTFELVEEKKMFTKNDLRNGDVILKRNGNVEILVLPLGTLVTKTGGFNRISEVQDDLTDSHFNDYDIVAVRRPTEDWHCRFDAFEGEYGTLVFDRERDTKKPLYNGKVVCIDLNGHINAYTVGKIYEFKNGCMTDDSGYTFGNGNEKFYTFDDWAKFTCSKFIEIVE